MILALEGVPGGGKTSILNHFSSNRYPDIAVVPEILAQEYELDTVDNQNWEREIYYLKNDLQKSFLAIQYSFGGKKVIMDRSIISTLAYNYALSALHHKNIYSLVIQKYQDFKSFLAPANHYVLLNLTIKQSYNRKKRVKSEYEIWNNTIFLSQLQNFYTKIFPLIAGLTPITRIETAEKPLRSVIKEIELCLI